MTPLLEVCDIETFYGVSQALFGVRFTIQQGEVTTLMGRNGMGKTTTVRSIMGTRPIATGKIIFRGQPIHTCSPETIGRMGIGIVPEGRQIFPNLTVKENLIAFASNRSGSAAPWTLARVYEFFPRLKERERNLGNQLSGGEQQMLAIGRALMTNPYLLILDEATEGLAPMLREEIWRCLKALKAAGQTILVIDKYIERLIDLGDHHTILENGQVVWQGSSDELRGRTDLWQQYLGV
jgi:branched-chain amino acid transport system ATP-binding protein